MATNGRRNASIMSLYFGKDRDKNMKKILYLFAALAVFTAMSYAQPRTPVKSDETKSASVAPAPQSLPAKYEGGVFGYSKSEKGTLKFDDINERLVFYGKDSKEKFSIPYKSMLVIYPNSKSVRSTAGTVVSNIPVLGAGIVGGLMKEKKRYLVINYNDPDVDSKGTTNFKLETLQTVEAVMQTLAKKANLKPRGDAYYRPAATGGDTN